MNPHSKNALYEALHIYIDRRIPRSSREFRVASSIVWEQSYPIASIVCQKFSNIPNLEPSELISILMMRLLNKRNEPFSEIKGARSYVKRAFENIATDSWRSESRHISPESSSGNKSKMLYLDQENEDGKTLLDFIAAPEEEHNDAWDVLNPLQEQLESYLYEKEIYLLAHRTPKGKRTFEQEAILFRKYRDNEYSPTGSPYKKFTRQRTRMLDHLEDKRGNLLQVTPEAADFLDLFAKEHNLQQVKLDIQDDADSVKKERRIQYHFDLLAFHKYMKVKSYDENDPMAHALFMNAVVSLFHEQLYRTQR